MAKRDWHLGIDVGGTKILAGVFNGGNEILGRSKRKTRGHGDPQAVLRRIVKTAREAIEASEADLKAIRSIGICVPGPIQPDEGLVIEAPNLGWRNVKVVEHLAGELGRPTYLSNDVTAGTWGEFSLGAGRGAGNLLGVFVGTGIGGGIVIDGRLYSGSSQEAGEIGHICLDPNGPACGCGRYGCLEAYASRTAIARHIRAAADRGESSPILDELDADAPIRSRLLKQAWEEEDPVVREAIGQSAYFLGIGLGSIANVLNPDRIVLGGGVVEALGNDYLELVDRSFARAAFRSAYQAARLVEASLGDDAGILGAALLARQRLEKK